MITRDQAESIAARFLGAPASDPEAGWELREFGAGWLVRGHNADGQRGNSGCVVERETGRVVAFPSAVPPRRILEEYPQVVDRRFPRELPSTD
jgi:hypothetical protein